MTTTFFIVWAIILVFNGILMHGLDWAVRSERFKKYRIRTPQNYEIPPLRKAINTNLNALFSLSIFGAFLWFFGNASIHAGWSASIPTYIGEVLGVLLLYDFMYYFLHRFMHVRWVLQYVHRVHHLVRFPTAPESIFLHPAETFAGLGLLLLSVYLFGPISAAAFLTIFFLHSTINIIVHSNLVIPHPAFRLTNFWAEKHDVHHHRMAHNYASIFPFWDQAFGTYK